MTGSCILLWALNIFAIAAILGSSLLLLCLYYVLCKALSIIFLLHRI